MDPIEFGIKIDDDYSTVLDKLKKKLVEAFEAGTESVEGFIKGQENANRAAEVIIAKNAKLRMQEEKAEAKRIKTAEADIKRQQAQAKAIWRENDQREKKSEKQRKQEEAHFKKMASIATWGLSDKLAPKAMAIGLWSALGAKVFEFTGNLADSIIKSIDFNNKLSLTLSLFGRTAEEGKRAASEVRAFSAATGVSMEESGKWRLDLEEMNLPEQMRQMTMNAMADIQAMGGNAGAMQNLVSSMREKQLAGRQTVQASEIAQFVKAAGLDQTRLERFLGIDSKDRLEANRALASLPVKIEDMPKLLAGAIYDKTGEALGRFAEQTTGGGIAGNLNRLKAGFFEALEKTNWEPLIEMTKDLTAWALDEKTIRAFSDGITNVVAKIPAFVQGISDFGDWLKKWGIISGEEDTGSRDPSDVRFEKDPFSLGSDALKKFKVDREKWQKVGEDMAAGIADGLSKKMQEATPGITSQMLSNVKKENEIHSPSKRWEREIGKQLGAGVNIGITKETAKASDVIAGPSLPSNIINNSNASKRYEVHFHQINVGNSGISQSQVKELFSTELLRTLQGLEVQA